MVLQWMLVYGRNQHNIVKQLSSNFKKQLHTILVKDNMCLLWVPEGDGHVGSLLTSASTSVPGVWRGKTRTYWMNEAWAQRPRQLFPIKCSLQGHSCCCCQVASVVSDSVRPHRRQPTRLPRPWDSPGKNTGVGCHFLLQNQWQSRNIYLWMIH